MKGSINIIVKRTDFTSQLPLNKCKIQYCFNKIEFVIDFMVYLDRKHGI